MPKKPMPVETVTPYATGQCKRDQIREVFDTLARRYDRLNRILSFGMDGVWRRRALKVLREPLPVRLLDLATGTADFAILAARLLPGTTITGIDLSRAMLAVGRGKVASAALAGRITLRVGDCLDLPFADRRFDAITIAFGVRNFERVSAGFREMRRVLTPGGRVVILELSEPARQPWRVLCRLYLRWVIPTVGRVLTGHAQEYAYLPASIRQVPQREAMLDLLRRAGFTRCRYDSYTLGVCTCYHACAPVDRLGV